LYYHHHHHHHHHRNYYYYCSNNNNNNNNNIWNVKTKVIPIIIGATGTISKSFRKYVSNIPGKREVKELEKTATLGTAHILILM
jgi:hypothetical protein